MLLETQRELCVCVKKRRRNCRFHYWKAHSSLLFWAMYKKKRSWSEGATREFIIVHEEKIFLHDSAEAPEGLLAEGVGHPSLEAAKLNWTRPCTTWPNLHIHPALSKSLKWQESALSPALRPDMHSALSKRLQLKTCRGPFHLNFSMTAYFKSSGIML